MKTSTPSRCASTAAAISAALTTSMRVTPAGVASAVGPLTSVTVGARLGRRLREREAHLARARVGDAAHRVDRLERRAGGEQHALARQHLRLRPRDDRGEDLLRLQHAAVAGLAAGLVAGAGPEDDDAVGDELRDVALGGRVGPHLPVHRRRDEQRAFAREAQRRQQVVGVAVRELGEEVGRGGRDDDGVGAAREIDVAHRVVGAGCPQVGAAPAGRTAPATSAA